jgi:hypothetical protein
MRSYNSSEILISVLRSTSFLLEHYGYSKHDPSLANYSFPSNVPRNASQYKREAMRKRSLLLNLRDESASKAVRLKNHR